MLFSLFVLSLVLTAALSELIQQPSSSSSSCNNKTIFFTSVFPNQSSPSAQLHSNATLFVSLDTCDHIFSFPCVSSDAHLAAQICSLFAAGSPFASSFSSPLSCASRFSTVISQKKAGLGSCSRLLEDHLDAPLRSYLKQLQWIILEESKYMGVRTWKFPFDAWIYLEILHADPPDVLIEVGNRFGGSALMFAHLFDQMNTNTRIIAVDIDHSDVHSISRNHPRIVWVEGDAIAVFPQVEALVHPHETVAVIEDASHIFEHTLQIMELYGSLVTSGQWMVIEDTVLHNGVENDIFDDPGAFLSVERFLTGEKGCEWETVREMERYIITWNPTGFLRKLGENSCELQGSGGSEGGDRAGAVRAAEEWRALVPDPSRVSSSSDLYSTASLLPVTVHINDATSTFTPPPPPFFLPSLYSSAVAFCSAHSVPPFALETCAGLVVAKSLATDPANQQISVPLLPCETATPFHVRTLPSSPTHSRSVATAILSGPGVAVLPFRLSPSLASKIRAVITDRPEYARAAAESLALSTRSRYLQPLCENAPPSSISFLTKP